MSGVRRHLVSVAAVMFAGMLAAAPVAAEKPADAGGKGAAQHENDKGDKGKGQKDKGRKHKGGNHNDGGSHAGKGGDAGLSVNVHFGQEARLAVRNYYHAEVSRGNCPPGLAKKNNGCTPPGQTKQWSRGHALPPDVVIYPLPPELEIRIGLPPAGHKFVRVASDILMIAVGTNMVVDAIEDLGNL